MSLIWLLVSLVLASLYSIWAGWSFSSLLVWFIALLLSCPYGYKMWKRQRWIRNKVEVTPEYENFVFANWNVAIGLLWIFQIVIIGFNVWLAVR